MQFERIKCTCCGNFIFRQKGNIEAEIICPSCRNINYTGRSDFNAIRGAEFQNKSSPLYCVKCGRLLMKLIGEGEIEIHCRYCKRYTRFDTKQYKDGTYPKPPVKDIAR